MRRILLILILNFVVFAGNAQLATIDVTQNGFSMEQIGIALNQLTAVKDQIEEAKKQLEVAKSSLKQAKQTADLLQAVADDKVDFSVISDLGITDLGNFVMKVLCIDPKDYVPNNSAYIKIIASFRSGIGECSNYNNYINSYSGMKYKLAEGYYGDDYGNGGNFEQMTDDMKAAEQQASAMEIVNDRTKMEIGYKYMDISADLEKKSEELSKALDSDDLKISKAERLNLKLSCVDYQLKSMDYKLKGMDLIATASQYTEAQKKSLEEQRTRLVLKRMIEMAHN